MKRTQNASESCLPEGRRLGHSSTGSHRWPRIPKDVTSPALLVLTVPVRGLNGATALSEKALCKKQEDMQIMCEVECCEGVKSELSHTVHCSCPKIRSDVMWGT